jgi:hypothetical protein
MQKSGAAFRGNRSELAADGQSARPSFVAHEMMQSQLQDFGAILVGFAERVQFGE